MDSSFDLSNPGVSSDWLVFLVILIPTALVIGGFVLWFALRSKGGKRHHKHDKRRKRRKLNPTLAQTSGLPPLRRPDEPPHGI
ncbi:MAG: hypothetical protein WCJ07_14025 [Verrucomicrobiota bacterium]